jgi:hypothetical protein
VFNAMDHKSAADDRAQKNRARRAWRLAMPGNKSCKDTSGYFFAGQFDRPRRWLQMPA